MHNAHQCLSAVVIVWKLGGGGLQCGMIVVVQPGHEGLACQEGWFYMMRGDGRVGGCSEFHWPTRAGIKLVECVARPHLIQFAAISTLHPVS